MSQSWQEIARKKREARDALIPHEWRLSSLPGADILDVRHIPRQCGILSAHELEITEEYDATDLAAAIKQQKFTCIDVTRAFCKRAAIAQQLVNCLTEVLFESAFARARSLDKQLKEGLITGPLFGVPISIKDSLNIAGVESSLGLTSMVGKQSTCNADLVDIILNAGAVIYCKTNVPQTMMALDSVNNVFGRTLNPINRLLTAGGSSGGEGALLAMRGSILGIGTDIGGSIRIPAYCNGVYGVKPSANRVPYTGLSDPGAPGMRYVGTQARAGPLAHSMRDCELLLRTVANAKPWEADPSLVPGFWESMDTSPRAALSAAKQKKSLVFGILTHDSVLMPLPPIEKMLDDVRQQLNGAGHKAIVVPVPSSFADARFLANQLMGLDGSQTMTSHLESMGEPWIPWLDGKIKKRQPRPLEQIRELYLQTQELRRELLAKLWKIPDGKGATIEADALIMPVAPHPVAPIDRWGDASYTTSIVFLDYCAGTVPVRTFHKDDTKHEMHGEPINKLDAYNRTLWDDPKQGKHIRQSYIGSSLSVQVLAPKLQERRLVRAMTVLDEVLKSSSKKQVGEVAKL